MTKKEKLALMSIADRIDELAGLEGCSLSEESKNEFRFYMQWFVSCAKYIREVVNLSDEDCRWIKSEKLSEIISLM